MNSSTMAKQQTGKGLGKSVKSVGKNVKKAVTSKVGKTLTASAALLLLLATLKNKKNKTKEEEQTISEIKKIANDENKALNFLLQATPTAAAVASAAGLAHRNSVKQIKNRNGSTTYEFPTNSVKPKK